MQLEYAKNPIWSNAEHTTIDLIIKWENIDAAYPFTASPNDCEAHGRQIFKLASEGVYGEIAEYVPPPPEPEPELNPSVTTATPSSGEVPATVL